MSRAVTVTGQTLTFTLNDGGVAVYDAAATAALGDPAKMVFNYTVGAADLPVYGLSFVRGDQNGTVIVDGMGRGPDFSGMPGEVDIRSRVTRAIPLNIPIMFLPFLLALAGCASVWRSRAGLSYALWSATMKEAVSLRRRRCSAKHPAFPKSINDPSGALRLQRQVEEIVA